MTNNTSLAKLIKHFENHKDFPISIDDIKAWIIKEAYQDEINFIESEEMDPRILRGQIVQYPRSGGVYAIPDRITDIYYSKQLSQCWIRFVCCKELVHILDNNKCKTSSQSEVADLTFSLTSPTDGLNKDKTYSPATEAEDMAVLSALKILAPWAIIEKLKPFYIEGTKTSKDIAAFLRIPEYYISFLMSEVYKEIVKIEW